MAVNPPISLSYSKLIMVGFTGHQINPDSVDNKGVEKVYFGEGSERSKGPTLHSEPDNCNGRDYSRTC